MAGGSSKGSIVAAYCSAGSWSLVAPRGGDVLVEAEVLFDCGDTDFKLEALVDFSLLELGELGVEALDVVFGCHLSAKIRDVVLSRHVLDDMAEHFAEFFEADFHCGHIVEVYHGGRRGHECADSADVTQHENRGRSARILEAGKRLKIMRIGCDVHHGFQQGRGQRGEGLSPAMRLRCSGVQRGKRDTSGGLGRRMTWQPKHRDGGAGQARSRGRGVLHFPEGFTRDDGPGNTG
jgi:hypothetical protein